MKTIKQTSGQATTELVIILPLFLILSAAVLAVTYICWQGIKVQQAANLAARIQGQERVGGAYAPMTGNTGVGIRNIQEENGTDVAGDQVPDIESVGADFGGREHAGPTRGVYGRYYQLVKAMFNPEEQKKLFIPLPNEGINSDRIEVTRVLVPPKLFGLELKPIKLAATAYGGEDPHAYGLPRWGKTTPGQGTPFYKSTIHNPRND